MGKRPAAGQLGFEIYEREDGDTGVRLIAANNEVLMHSEGYKDPRSAHGLIDLLMGKAADAQVVDLRD